MPLNQRIWAYVWLLFILFALLGAHYYVYRFSFHPLNPFQVTRALVFASILWCSVLLVSMLLRLGWARYVMATWVVIAMIGFIMAMLMMNSQSVDPLPEPTHAVLKGLFFYALALVPLGISNALRRFLAPRTAGGK